MHHTTPRQKHRLTLQVLADGLFFTRPSGAKIRKTSLLPPRPIFAVLAYRIPCTFTNPKFPTVSANVLPCLATIWSSSAPTSVVERFSGKRTNEKFNVGIECGERAPPRDLGLCKTAREHSGLGVPHKGWKLTGPSNGHFLSRRRSERLVSPLKAISTVYTGASSASKPRSNAALEIPDYLLSPDRHATRLHTYKIQPRHLWTKQRRGSNCHK